MASKQSANLLPEYLKTDKNLKFLSGTLDPLLQTPQLERIDGFVGSKITPNYKKADSYLKETLPLREEYPLEPALVFRDKISNITDVISFDDIINEIGIQGGKTENLDTLFKSKFYSYDPYIDWDKLVNYNQYYWLPNGPDPIVISTSTNVFTNVIGTSTYVMPNGYALSNGMKISFTTSFSSGSNTISSGTEYIVEGVGSGIKLIKFKLLEVNESIAGVYNETFDGELFDSFPFDGDKTLPLTPEYITINKSSKDLNSWSRYNRWFHGEILRITAKINNQPSVVYPLDSRAQRPIVEFKPDIQLYNFGSQGITNIDIIDTDTTSTNVVEGSLGYYVDGILLEQGNRIIFNACTSTIYTVNYDVSTDPPTLRLIENTIPTLKDSVAVNNGLSNRGTSWYFDTKLINNNYVTKWWKAQQHTLINQAPLFDLYDNSDPPKSYTEYNSNFEGNKIFGYEIGTGNSDKILGFPLKYKNSVGIGSYLFKNYFTSEVITITYNARLTKTISSGITYFKVNNTLTNIWKSAVDYKTPVIETQTILNPTNTATITSINTSATSVISFVNGNLVKSSLSGDGLTVKFNNTLTTNDLVILEITSNSIPNANGFYKTPLSLTNNPLNGPITSMTLSELSDHVSTMINRVSGFNGVFPGVSNLRDLNGYSIYGNRLIVNSNPIAFSQIFLGKKEHNVIDAIRLASEKYNQFKMNLLRSISNISAYLTPADSLDKILTDINVNSNNRSSYYNSDMLGYGSDKKTLVTTSTNSIININSLLDSPFDLTTSSFRSLSVYIDNIQLVNESEYIIHKYDETIEILKTINTGSVVSVNYYHDTHGSFIPATPSKLGLYPKYKPAKYVSTPNTYTGAVTLIQGHDGSVMKAYGDHRDDVILEYEKRVYNNIKINYNPKIFDVMTSMPGAFRKTDYSLNDAVSIITKDITRWAGSYNIDISTNNTFDEYNPFTWNYVGSFDKLSNSPVSGYWRNLYKYFYDTDRPHTHPWEMLGYTEKPSWWDTYYSWTNPTKRTNLITAITRGSTSTTVNSNYARPGFSSIVPVSTSSVLLSPAECLVSDNSYYDKKSNWKIGDQSPTETIWRSSSYWPFVANILAATLYPSSYTSMMYDVSRVSVNSLGQILYEDDLYLNPNKIKINGEVSGYGVYVVEKGLLKDLNYVDSLKQDLTYLDFNLFHKLGGFASKDKLQIVIDSIDPVSQAQGAVLPPEDYSLILNISNPIKSSSISGVIIQKLNGMFVVKGYDKTNPYFNILKPNKQSQSKKISVGGISSPFTEWSGVVNNGNSGLSSIDITSASPNTTHYYKSGQIVRYNGAYYVVTVGHSTKATFDISLFQKLPELPMTGGASVQSYPTFEKSITQIYYGTSFSTLQDVYDLLVGYGAYLESQGFIFDEYNADLNDIVNWKYTGKEFLYWTTQNWADGNLITLSPFADYLKYSYKNSIVDDIAFGDYEYSLLKADGKSFPIDKFRLSREDGVCTINTIDTLEGMFFATLNSVQKEHGMVFNNTTIFNDTIYDIETGYKQRRIKLSGFRTKNWNGDLSSPGFVYDNVSIIDWAPYKIYLPTIIVRYNGAYYQSNSKINGDAVFDFNKWTKLNKKPVSNLLPNFDYKINQFEDFYSLDIDNFDSTQQELAQHLIGYTPRTYFNNIFTNPITQYKFYQGFIKEKGTKNAIDKLSKVGLFTREGNVSFNEDWAFRIGNYGSFRTYKELEFNLTENSTLENVHVVKLVDTIPDNSNPLISYVPLSNFLVTPENNITSSTFVTKPSTFFDNNLILTTAGYVRLSDVTATAYNKNSLLDIANNSVLMEGDTFWMGFLENGDWGVRRYTKQSAKIAGVYVSAPAESITFTTDRNHNLSVGDIISIVRFNKQVDGIHIITDIPRLDQISVASALTSIVNEDLVSNGEMFAFENARFANLKEISKFTNLLNLKTGEKIWIDEGVGNKWQVYEKTKNYSTATYYKSVPPQTRQLLGHSVYMSNNDEFLMVSAPGHTITNSLSVGTVKVYTTNKTTNTFDEQFEYTLNSDDAVYCALDWPILFGHSLSYDSGKGLYFTGAPKATNVVINSADVASKGVVILSTGSGHSKSFFQEGLVKISSSELQLKEITEAVIVNPYSTSTFDAYAAQFGYSIYTNNVETNNTTTLIVGAPGSGLGGRVYAYGITRPNYYKASRAEVILALAAELSAPVYYGEVTIINWMTTGLTGFSKFWFDYRSANPIDAAIYDAQRRADAIGVFGAPIVETRANVIRAYQNNPKAQLYPNEEDIRYWMTYGLGANNSTFNYAVYFSNFYNPAQLQHNIDERAAALLISPVTNVAKHHRGIEVLSHEPITSGARWGHKISGNSDGSIIAISAPYLSVAPGILGIVQIYDSNLNWSQTLSTPFKTSAGFGSEVCVSSDGSYLVVASAVKGEIASYISTGREQVAVYKKTPTDYNNYQATRPQVILALALNLLAPVYYGEVTIINWMTVGLTGFDQFWIDYRASNPADAEIYDAQRAADALNIVSTRGEVIAAYQNNNDAQLYPNEEDIRYWMLTGLGAGNAIFNQVVIQENIANPEQYKRNLAERALGLATTPYIFTLHQIINNPLLTNDLEFGRAISISKDNNTLGISAVGKTTADLIKFDSSSKIGETTFDGNTTKFTNVKADAGTVYVYNKIDDYFILAEEVIDISIVEGSQYGTSLVVTNDKVIVGAPYDVQQTIDRSRFYQFNKLNSSSVGSWKLISQQPDIVDILTVDRVALIDSFKEEIVEYLDIVDPLKGKIAGLAEQELKYKSVFDPATYTIGIASSIVDSSSSWIDEHVGELWWDLSTAKYMWYEQSDDIFKKNNWGKLFPGASIDVYEWVRSNLMPSEWAAQADTNKGLTFGISGQPKYPDNSVVSIKQLFNNVTNSFENVYFFWVKNKVVVPDVKNRRLSSYDVSRIIVDPAAYGLKFVEILSPDSLAFTNIQSVINGNRINANIAIDTISNEIPRHTEWALLAEGDAKGTVPASIEKKLFDSLLGHDDAGRAVPDQLLTYRSKYGTGIRPQQTLFKDRIQALRTVVEFANSVLIKNKITANYSFKNLLKKEEIPDILSREYDFSVSNRSNLDNILYSTTVKYSQAILECYVNNGRIISVNILSSGYGYTYPPKVNILSDQGADAEILTEIDSDGRVISVTINKTGSGYESPPVLVVRPQTVIVEFNEDYDYRWTKHEYDYILSDKEQMPVWTRVKNQTYNTPLFWKYVDWTSDEYVPFKEYSYVIEGVYGLETLTGILPGEYVKLNNAIITDSAALYIILERLPDTESGNFSSSYNVVFVENGTIQILDSIWNYSQSTYAYDVSTLDETLYDQIPDLEVLYIMKALKDDIFINELLVNWNLLFFKAVKYALTEQKLLDWAFKTSFINVTNSIGTLDQRSVYKLDNEQYFEDYINEVKPYHSQIRKYTSNYSYLENTSEGVPLNSTDFDLPSHYNTSTNKFDVVTLANTSLINQQPWKSWADNYTSEVGEIIVSNNGTRYTTQPIVTISGGGDLVTSTATAVAYIRSGGVYKILITNPGAGYTETPLVSITGGGPYVVSSATAGASLLNLKTRKNKIGIKFDRISVNSEIGIINVSDTFICPGDKQQFILSWLAEPSKLTITATLDGRLILANEYTIEYYTEKYNGFDKKYSRFVFLNIVPANGQIFKISYNKNINLYTAVDRIKTLYTGGNPISSLMTGTEYPGMITQGLLFDYSQPWDTINGNAKYDNNSTWSELVDYYTTAKLISTATIGDSTLYLNTTTGIVSGQVINILNSPTIRIRPDTIVKSVNTSTRSITISQPVFRIIEAKSTTTTIGSKIILKTTPPFNGGIVVGDNVTITGITSSGYNGSYKVSSILDADQFSITATSILSTTTSIPSIAASATIVTLLTTIRSNDILLDSISGYYLTTAAKIVVKLPTFYDDIIKISVFLDGSASPLATGIPIVGPYPNAEYYYMTRGTDGRAIVNFYQMSNSSYNIQFSIYGNPTIEFWKPDTLVSELDTSISGGSWNALGNLVGALGDTIIDGDSFLNTRSGYAPEELVAGHSVDSLGINVYTKLDNSYANVYSGSFPVTAGSTPSATLSRSLNSAGLMVHYNGQIFNRLSAVDTNTGPYFSKNIAAPRGSFNADIIANTILDDDSFQRFDLPFSWNMFGTDYSQVYLGTNGYITFGNGGSFWNPLVINALDYNQVSAQSAIFVEYCDLWQRVSLNNNGPLITGEQPGYYFASGVVGEFGYWRIRFQGSHYMNRYDEIMPAYNFELTLYTNGIDQYVEMIYEKTWKGANINGEVGFVAGIAHNGTPADNIEIPYTSIEDGSSHVFYSTSNGGNWKYAGVGRFESVRSPLAFTSVNQFYTKGNTIYLAPQTTSGRAGYTMFDIGGDRSVIDSNIVSVENTSTAILESLASFNDIQKAYVLIDGYEASLVNSTTEYGYMLTYVGENNNRACVKIYGLNSVSHTIQAWFFESKYTKFNRIHEEIFSIGTTATSNFTITIIPGVIKPVSEQIIVEKGTFSGTSIRQRLLPPKASYYIVKNNQRVFDIDGSTLHPQNTYSADKIKVYANGVELRPGFDYAVDTIYSNITLADGLLRDGDALAIEVLNSQDFTITDNLLKLTTPISNTTIKVTSFTDHDNMMIRTERFKGNIYRTYKLTFPILNDNYIWVYVNGIPLTSRYDFEILDDAQTIKLGDTISLGNSDNVMFTTINPSSYGNTILGFRVFNDMFNRHHYKRISEYYSTTLAQPLHSYDKSIWVTDASKLIPPNPLTNKPGVVIIDGERIEFMVKDGNVLRELRRSTLGTAAATFSIPGTLVIDQSLQQTIPYSSEVNLIQTTSTTALTYVISTVSNLITGDGITLNPNIDATNQVSVFYGGRELRKTSLNIHDRSKSYDVTADSIIILPPEFKITTSTNELILSVSDIPSIDTKITIVQRKGQVWTGTESLLTSDVVQAQFLRDKEAELPSLYYYGGFINEPLVAGSVTIMTQFRQSSSTNPDAPVIITPLLVSGGQGFIANVAIGPRLPRHGIVTIVNKQIRYIPYTAWEGVDIFDYNISDKSGNIAYAPILVSTEKIRFIDKIVVSVASNSITEINLNDYLKTGGPVTKFEFTIASERFTSASANSVYYNNIGLPLGTRGDFFAVLAYDIQNNTIDGYVRIDIYDSVAVITAGPIKASVVINSDVYYLEPVLLDGGPINVVTVDTSTHATTSIDNFKIGYLPNSGYESSTIKFLKTIPGAPTYTLSEIASNSSRYYIYEGRKYAYVEFFSIDSSSGLDAGLEEWGWVSNLVQDDFFYTIEDPNGRSSSAIVSMVVYKPIALRNETVGVYYNTQQLLPISRGFYTLGYGIPYAEDAMGSRYMYNNYTGYSIGCSVQITNLPENGVASVDGLGFNYTFTRSPTEFLSSHNPNSPSSTIAFDHIDYILTTPFSVSTSSVRIECFYITAGFIGITSSRAIPIVIKPIVQYGGPLIDVRINTTPPYGTFEITAEKLILYTYDPTMPPPYQVDFTYSIQDSYGNWSLPAAGVINPSPV